MQSSMVHVVECDIALFRNGALLGRVHDAGAHQTKHAHHAQVHAEWTANDMS